MTPQSAPPALKKETTGMGVLQTSAPTEQRSRPARRAHHRRSWVPYLLVAPAAIMFLLVIAYPFLQSLAYGLYRESLLTPGSKFVGLRNVQADLGDPKFWTIVAQTGVFVAASTLLAFVIALAVALALNTAIVARTFWRSALLLPWILPGVVVSFLWMWIFDTNYGLLNAVVSALGGPSHTNWLNTPSFAMAAIIVAKVWHSFPWMAVLLLASLQGVPPEIHDAALVDGATGWRKQVHVVLPQIRSAIALTLLLETIWGLQQFEIPYVMTGGGPAGSTETLSIALYKSAFTRFDLGQAGAIGILWTVLMAGLVAVYMWYTIKQERRAKA